MVVEGSVWAARWGPSIAAIKAIEKSLATSGKGITDSIVRPGNHASGPQYVRVGIKQLYKVHVPLAASRLTSTHLPLKELIDNNEPDPDMNSIVMANKETRAAFEDMKTKYSVCGFEFFLPES